MRTLFIDDLRNPYDSSWDVVRDADSARTAIAAAQKDDNDLGEDVNGQPLEEGREVLNLLEMQEVLHGVAMPQEIRVHTANVSAQAYMERCLKARSYRFCGSIAFNDGHDTARVWRR